MAKERRDQFPDAFIFECLKKLASAESPIIIVSQDGDYVAPVEATTDIKLVKTFADLFAELGLAIEPPDVQGFFEADYDELVSRFDDEVSAWGLHVSDVAGAEIDESTVTDVTLDRFKAFRVVDEEQILVVGSAMVKATWHLLTRTGIPRLGTRRQNRYTASGRERRDRG